MDAISANALGLPAFEVLTPTDPLVALVSEWRAFRRAWEDEAAKPGAGDADTPECLRLEAIRDRLSQQIQATKPTRAEGVKALLEFSWIDDSGDYMGDDHISVSKEVMRNIMEAHGLIGGAA